MAGSRKPGPQCSYNDRVDIDDGTMCVAKSPRPGPLGVRSRPSLINNESFERLIAPCSMSRFTSPLINNKTLPERPALVPFNTGTSEHSAPSSFSDGLGSIMLPCEVTHFGIPCQQRFRRTHRLAPQNRAYL